MESKNSHINKIAILFLILFLVSMIYVVGLLGNMQNQINGTKAKFDFICEELNELSDVNYDDEFSDIYNKIEELNKLYITRYHGFYDYNIHKDMRELYYGRLYIPDLDISVGLYKGVDQSITDRNDSANIFSFGESLGITIADHNNQEFSKLFYTKVGTKGYINNRYQQRIYLECTDVFNGYNTGYIVDESGVIAMGKDDYLMYTCRSSGGVLITLWNVIAKE